MTPRHVLPRLLLVLAALLLVGLRAARADGDGATALERLTAEERSYLEQSPRWAELDDAQKERIARNVIRLRELGPEERARFLRRLEEIRQHEGEAGGGPGPADRFRRLRGEEERRRLLLPRLVGLQLWQDLGPQAAQAVEAAGGREARTLVEVGFFRRMNEHVIEAMVAGGLPEPVIPDDLPEPQKDRLRRLVDRANGGDQGAARALAAWTVTAAQRALLRRLAGAQPPDEAALREVAAALRERYQDAYRATLAELRPVVADPERLAALLREARGGHGGPASAEDRGRAERLLQAIEAAGRFEDPRLRLLVEGLRRRLEQVVRGEEGGPRWGGRGRPPGPPRRGPGGGGGRPPGAPPGGSAPPEAPPGDGSR